MSFEYKPVSLEEYNQTLRDSVNAYYTLNPGNRQERKLKLDPKNLSGLRERTGKPSR